MPIYKLPKLTTIPTDVKIKPNQRKKILAIMGTRKVIAVFNPRYKDQLWIVIEHEDIRNKKKHVPPFKYRKLLFGERGSILEERAGNIIYGDGDIIDDFTIYTSRH
jgi:hypothetical protein